MSNSLETRYPPSNFTQTPLDTFVTVVPEQKVHHVVSRMDEMYPIAPMLRVYLFRDKFKTSESQVTAVESWKEIVQDATITNPMMDEMYTFPFQSFDWENDKCGDYRSNTSLPTGNLLARTYCLPFTINPDWSVQVYSMNSIYDYPVSGYVVADRRKLREHFNVQRCGDWMLEVIREYATRWLTDMVLSTNLNLYSLSSISAGACTSRLIRGDAQLEELLKEMKK